MGLKSSSTRGKGELIIEGPALVSVLLLLKWGGFPSRASIVDALNEAKRTLKDVKTWNGLGE
jgi:hypothetical protein